ncbi:MAG: adenylyltransferase/cytidyltransferase family protein [bacterium]|nr:adenylyltransferase/cytidyltransferase family protein [bacterium]
MKTVLVFGTFDILHPGHIHFLRQAKRHGDFLIVSIARSKIAEKIKGRGILHSEEDRKRLLQSLKFVDKVVLGSRKDYLSHIVQLRPDVIVLGYDQKVFTQGLREKLAKRGLKSKIVRAKGYKPRYYKSSKLLGG